ncbi:N-acetyltransferase [Oceanobacillus sp. J11TS1]|uniref:N-acetyltransferase n=1 Tax=Oceanobacillus sp. J11TS1 TaxID=2807191 RepID=UPI001B240BF8|nr:N-acetyltransferase [Oceanobacillus sp. J11TS1]GIO22310.1 putative N-acetyltransferase YlbP [Oceanobacillus sp. J11TS1]
MENIKIENLLINFKTLENFKRFREYGNQELTMMEDLQNKIIENNSKSPFYGIYIGDSLIARMSLYEVSRKYDFYFEPAQDYLTLWKLEVLPNYQGKGYGKALVDFAKSFQLPIKTSPRINSHGFWEKMGFIKPHYEMERDLGENPLLWLPEGVKEKDTKQ